MRKHRRVIAGAVATVGSVLVVIGIVYLTVACEQLPGILGPHAGDTSPRTTLGIIVLALGLAALAVAVAVARRRPPGTPVHT